MYNATNLKYQYIITSELKVSGYHAFSVHLITALIKAINYNANIYDFKSNQLIWKNIWNQTTE